MGGLILPVLTTERLVLEPLGEQHLEHLVGLDADPAVMRLLTGRASSRAEVVAAMARRTRADAAERGLGYWAGLVDGSFAGWWSLAADDADTGAAELGYRLRQDVWGDGLATERARAVLEHAFGTVGLRRVWAETMAVNTASRRVLEKVGLRHVSTYVGQWDEPLPGSEAGEVVYELVRDEHRPGVGRSIEQTGSGG